MPAVYGRLGGMDKTTVYLTGEQKASLARAARAQGRSEAHIIRAGIDAMTAGHRVGEAPPALAHDSPPRRSGGASLDRPRWIERDDFVRVILRDLADAGLRADLRDLVPGSTDDEPIP